MMGFLSPTFANAPMDLEGKKPAPSTPIYSGEAHGSSTPSPWRLPLPPVTPLPLAELGEALPRSPLLPPPRRRAAGSPSTSPSPCWIKKEETSSPTVRVLNAEVPSVRRLVIGDLDHDEYDSINPVHLNASARDLQGYVDALFSLSLLEDSIDCSW